MSKRQNTIEWDSLIVASVDTLPKGVFMILRTSAKSPTVAARQKARSAGIPGEITVVQQHPLNKTTGNTVFAELLKSLKRFPYGDSKCLVKAAAKSILRKYNQLSSDDPNQLELRKALYEKDVDEQLLLLKETNKRVNNLSAQEARLESIVAELDQKRQSLIEEIDELNRDKQPLSELINDVRDKVYELRTIYGDLNELAEFEGEEDRSDTYWERRVLLRKISDWVDAHCPE